MEAVAARHCHVATCLSIVFAKLCRMRRAISKPFLHEMLHGGLQKMRFTQPVRVFFGGYRSKNGVSFCGK
ncbi:hypothetical protein LF95_07095 [Thalassospira sp. TSL5-1]|nr:hypothetical protein LF95_07095 [Thalassospira sp. TSL5-1]